MSNIEFVEAMPVTATRAERFAAGKALRDQSSPHQSWGVVISC